MQVVGRQGVPQGGSHGVVQGLGAGVGHFNLEEGGRQAGLAVVERDERVEGAQAGQAGEGRVAEIEAGQGELASEDPLLEVGRARHGLAVHAKAETGRAHIPVGAAEWGLDVACQDASIHQPAVFFGFDREMREAIGAALVWMVEDLPIDQPAVARQADAAGADPAQGEGNLTGLKAGISPGNTRDCHIQIL